LIAAPGSAVLKCDRLEAGTDRSEVFTAAQAFCGVYKVTAKVAFGRPIGGKAQVRVTQFAGTDDQEFEVYSIDVANPQAVEVKLEGGSRAELATLPDEEPRGWQYLDSTPEPASRHSSA
jgi:hypothetical protein